MAKKIVLQIPTIQVRKDELKIASKEQGYTMSGLVNKIIADYLEAYFKKGLK